MAPVLAAVPELEPEPIAARLSEPEPPSSSRCARRAARVEPLGARAPCTRRAGPRAVRDEESSYVLMYLREFASRRRRAAGEFDSLVRESFGDLIGRRAVSPALAQRQLLLAARRAAGDRRGARGRSWSPGGSSAAEDGDASAPPPGRRLVRRARRAVPLRPGSRADRVRPARDPEALGVAHPVLPCGAKIVLRYGDDAGADAGDRPRHGRPGPRVRPHGGAARAASGSPACSRSAGASPPTPDAR